MKYIYAFLMLASAIAISSCSKYDASQLPLKLQDGTISFPLDNKSPFLTFSIQYIEADNTLSIYNDLLSSIDFYSLTNKQLIKRILLKGKGPNWIGHASVVQISHHVINNNSIAVFNASSETFLLIDSLGNVKKKIRVDRMDNKDRSFYASGGQPMPASHMIYVDSCMYLTGDLSDNRINDHLVKNMIKIDLKTEKVSWFFNRPGFFNKGNWGANGNMYALSNTYNDQKKEIYMAYNASDSIYVLNGGLETIKTVSARSQAIGDISPMMKRSANARSHESVRYDYTTSQYQELIYDPYKKLIYRLTYLGLDNDKYTIGGDELMYGRQETIIVMNENFEVLHEFRLPLKTYYTPMYFLTKDGLYFANKANYKKNSSAMTFGLFKF